MSSVSRGIQLRGVRMSTVGGSRDVRVSGVGQWRCVSARLALALPDGQSHQSPREVLGVAMNELRRAAEAKRFMRLARRLADIAEGRIERVTWSSRKSPRGVR